MKTIVAAVDFSPGTPVVVDMAVSLAKAFGADLRLFHAIAPEPAFVTYGFTAAELPPMSALREEIRTRCHRKMDELLAKARADVPQATSLITEGSPLTELLEYVKRGGGDFVVLGSHGHGVLGGLLLGSVAEGMVRKATVPTLVVPVPRE
jgi:nucleotide-binding universal stress UspA family protein